MIIHLYMMKRDQITVLDYARKLTLVEQRRTERTFTMS